jgi:16S rRNA processing protein RimM
MEKLFSLFTRLSLLWVALILLLIQPPLYSSLKVACWYHLRWDSLRQRISRFSASMSPSMVPMKNAGAKRMHSPVRRESNIKSTGGVDKYAQFSRAKEVASRHGFDIVPTTLSAAMVSNTSAATVSPSWIRLNNIENVSPHENGATEKDIEELLTSEFCEIGVVAKPHGVNGEIKASMAKTDFAVQRLRVGRSVYIRQRHTMVPLSVKIVRSRQSDHHEHILKLEGMSTRDQAELLRGAKFYVHVDDRPSLAKDEYLIRDLVGFKCFLTSDNSTFVGEIDGIVPPIELCRSPILAQKIHPLIELKLNRLPFKIHTRLNKHAPRQEVADFRENDKFCLVPFVSAIVTNIDTFSRTVYIDPPLGLLELTYSKVKRKMISRVHSSIPVLQHKYELSGSKSVVVEAVKGTPP